MTIKRQPQAIICDHCDNHDYYHGDKKEVWRQAKKKGWLIYKGKHFDTEECLQDYKQGKTYTLSVGDYY